ncbi:hypothetical protein ENBRE01_2473 [Enteropsectra breve]|nr:hypothetical protein ENBRE01_2473 [Enteropsectra breve]
MIFKEVLSQILAGRFTPMPFTNPKAKELSVKIEGSGKEAAIFLLPDMLESAVLKDDITARYQKDLLHSYEPDTNINELTSYSKESQDELNQILWRLEYAYIYLNALKNQNYCLSTDAKNFSILFESSLNKNKLECFEKISAEPMPTMKLSKKYDLTMIMIIFEMRHKLFTTEHMKMTLAQCIEVLELYADLGFEPHATADIFVHDSKKQHAHVKIKCDLVFGLNLYRLLKKQELLEKFTKTDNSVLYKRLYFIEPLFRIVKVKHHVLDKTFEINFVEPLHKMRYRLGSEQEICIHTRRKGVSSKIISFLNLFNEGTPVFKNIVKLVGWVPKSRFTGLDVIFCSLLRLLPQIKELNLYNTPDSAYNLIHKDTSSYFDHLLYSLLANNREVLNGLNGFEVFGFNSPDVYTFAHLKQYKFKTLGLRGIFSKADLAYMWLAFKEEGTTDGKCYSNLALEDDSEHEYGVTTSEYNYLRNSVTHLVGSEEIIQEALRYRLVENLVAGTAVLHRYNDHYKLYEHEMAIMEEYNNFKKNCKNGRDYPLPLITLKVDATKDLMEQYYFGIREMNKYLLNTIPLYKILKQNGKLIYSVNNLVILEEGPYIESYGSVKALRTITTSEVRPYGKSYDVAYALKTFVKINDTLEVAVTEHDLKDSHFNYWLKTFDLEVLNLVLNYQLNEYVIDKNGEKYQKLSKYSITPAYELLKAYYDSTSNNTLTVLFNTPKIFDSVEADLQKQIEKVMLEVIYDWLYCDERKNFEKLSVTEKKKMLSALRFERSTKYKEALCHTPVGI